MMTTDAATTVDETAEIAEIADLMHMRARTYGMLARLFRQEVDDETLAQVQRMRFPQATGNAQVDEGYRMLYDYLKTAWSDSLRELAVDYVRTFIGHGVNGYSAAYPFESVYTSERRLMMQEARAEVLETFRANNLKSGAWRESEDHIALELEFVQRLSLRTEDALREGDVDEAVRQLQVQRDFLHDHILNWLPMLTADIEKFAQTSFYQGLARLTQGYVEEDAELVQELLDSAK